ncbi:hypothetical protein PIIN_03226 [Serendipita indica DSM 11827]|uniref:Uncharacterized protein n=1 Tax=Serendipita indica (strain DSM 11827) TaxID=1109443 RepID=G4TDE6_SERID|nr:hypothetical protein PIIN_03226 [Serendipita indica DSM 11827]
MKYFPLHRSNSDSSPQPTNVAAQDPFAPSIVTTVELAPKRPVHTPRKVKSAPKLSEPTASVFEPTSPTPRFRGSHRISNLTFKFRFFKARHAGSASSIIEGQPLSSPSGFAVPIASVINEQAGDPNCSSSKLHKMSKAVARLQVHSAHPRVNTAPSHTHTIGEMEHLSAGSGVVDSRFDEMTGRYDLSPTVLLPTRPDTEGWRSSGVSSIEDSAGPGTPTDLIPSLQGSDYLDKTVAQASIDEAGYQEVVGVLSSLFPSRGDEIMDASRQSLDASIAEGNSPILRPIDSHATTHTSHRRRINSSNVEGRADVRPALPPRSSSLPSNKF